MDTECYAMQFKGSDLLFLLMEVISVCSILHCILLNGVSSAKKSLPLKYLPVPGMFIFFFFFFSFLQR